MPRRRLALALAGLLLASAACGDDDGSGPSEVNVAGMYTLATANGQPVPATVLGSGNNRTDVVSGTLDLNTDKSFTLRVVLRLVLSGSPFEQPTTTSGTYTATGDKVTLKESGGASTDLTIKGTELTGSYQGVSIVLRRQ